MTEWSGIGRAQLARFVLVGGLNTAFGYAVYLVLLLVGMPYPVASLGALVLGILTGFRLHGSLVFDNRDSSLLWRFVACWATIYLCNVMFIKVLLLLGVDAYWAGGIAIVPVALLSYVTQKFLVFGKKA